MMTELAGWRHKFQTKQGAASRLTINHLRKGLEPAAEAREQQRRCFPALGAVPALYFFPTAPDFSPLELAEAGKQAATYSITNMKMV